MPGWPLVLLLVGCSDYGLFGENGPKTPLDTGESFDGESDTAFTIACPDLVPLPDTTAIDESCHTEPVTTSLASKVEWSRDELGGPPEYVQVLTAPMVGQLDDDNNDGVIDRNDTPDIVVVADDNGTDNADRFGVLYVVAGLDGSNEAAIDISDWGSDTQVRPYRYATPALGDLDADGVPEIVTVVRVLQSGGGGGGGGGGDIPDTASSGGGPDTGGDTAMDGGVGPPPPPSDIVGDPNEVCAVAAWHIDGTLQWVSDHTVECAGHLVALADLDGDGTGEVLVDDAVLDDSGGLLWEMGAGARYAAYPDLGTDPVALDLDGDGSPEVLDGRIVYEFDGTERCRIPDADPDGFPAAADLDGDLRGEIVLVGDGQVHAYEDDCTPAGNWVLTGAGNGGPPTIADFDGDGSPEIGLADAEFYSVYEVDGSVLWSAACTDASSHATGSSVFDFDGDGRAEVLYGDEVTLWVFDGATGAVRLEDTSHTSRTLHELPTVADVDGDGEMEIVIGQGGGHYGVEKGGMYVLGSDADPWRGDRQIWNQHAWTITNVADDLTLPYPATPNWPFSNTFRSGDLGASVPGGALPDAIGTIQACDDPCAYEQVGVEVRLGNGGMAAMRAGVPIALYAEVGGVPKLIRTLRSETVVEPGAATDTFELHVRISSIPDGVLLLRVDDDGTGLGQLNECHEDNNEARLEGVVCP